MSSHYPIYPNDHVFADGQTFKNLRDAVVAASMTGMWHVAYELASRYHAQDMICLKCGVPDLSSQRHTYYQYRGKAIRVCMKCSARGTSLPR